MTTNQYSEEKNRYPSRTVTAENLRLALEKRKISVRRAAKVIGISRAMLIKYLAGECRPSEASFEKMNRALGITREELYGSFNLGAGMKSMAQVMNDDEMLSILHEVPMEDQELFISYCYVGAVEKLYLEEP